MSANGEDQSINHKFNSTSNSNSRHTRHKRYVAHINPIYRNFDFLKKDGEYFDKKCIIQWAKFKQSFSIIFDATLKFGTHNVIQN